MAHLGENLLKMAIFTEMQQIADCICTAIAYLVFFYIVGN